jgi:S-formylglutathione hydrolase FrmB
MAILDVTYMSVALNRNTTFQIILPADRMNPACTEYLPLQPYKTLYLLHGLQDNSRGWLTSTRIKRLATLMNLAVVMPQGDNSYYVDRPLTRENYGELIGRELVEITRRMFPLSHKWEDTYIGGLSMGGFGAIRNGLKYHDTFSRIIGLSSALHVFEEPESFFDGFGKDRFGAYEDAVKTDKNPRVAAKNMLEKKKADPSLKLPKLYLACGDSDLVAGGALLKGNRSFRDFLIAQGLELTYAEEAGIGHSWDFWDDYIAKGLEWLKENEE